MILSGHGHTEQRVWQQTLTSRSDLVPLAAQGPQPLPLYPIATTHGSHQFAHQSDLVLDSVSELAVRAGVDHGVEHSVNKL